MIKTIKRLLGDVKDQSQNVPGFKANKNLTPVNTLADDAFKYVGLSVAKKVYDFNPEN